MWKPFLHHLHFIFYPFRDECALNHHNNTYPELLLGEGVLNTINESKKGICVKNTLYENLAITNFTG